MANKKSSTKKAVKVADQGCAAPMAKNVIIGVLMAVVVCLILGFSMAIVVLKNRITTLESAQCENVIVEDD